ncbi:PDI [Symbiodinium natans]|uniref:PDI protein n=1 Tax=Symbiodinium natans TaxID=878477 RepID=A0A812UXB0_9DINO|nr:PDI [Symbiodinium natans]
MGYGDGKGKGGPPMWYGLNPWMMMMMKGKGKGKGGLRSFDQKLKVWIGGLPADNCSIDLNKRLKEHMSSAGGNCLYAEVGKSGNAGAAFKTQEEAVAAINALNGSVFEGIQLHVDEWTRKEPTPPPGV